MKQIKHIFRVHKNPSGEYEECPVCGLCSFDHLHYEGDEPKDYKKIGDDVLYAHTEKEERGLHKCDATLTTASDEPVANSLVGDWKNSWKKIGIERGYWDYWSERMDKCDCCGKIKDGKFICGTCEECL
jgi:hypothetical protein